MKIIYRLSFLLSVTALFSCNMEMPHDCKLRVENIGTKNVIVVTGAQGVDSVDVKDFVEYYGFLQDNEIRNNVAPHTFNHTIKPSQIDTFCVDSWEKNKAIFIVEVDSLEYCIKNHIKAKYFNDYRKLVLNSSTLKLINWHLKFNYDSLKTY